MASPDRPFPLGLLAALGGDGPRWSVPALVRLAPAAEEAGFASLLVEAGVPAPAGPAAGALGSGRPDPFVLLGALAAGTGSLRLGAAVLAGERPAPMLAKVAATLDACAGGRSLLVLAGLGANPPIGLQQLQEELEVCRAMLRVQAPRLSGSRYHLDEAWNEPRGGRLEPLPLGVLVPAGPAVAEEATDAGLELGARLCELALVDLRAPERPPATRFEELAGRFARAARAAGRPEGSVGLHALLGPGEAGREGELAALAAACRDAGWAGLSLAWPAAGADGQPSEPGEAAARLSGWHELLAAATQREAAGGAGGPQGSCSPSSSWR